MNKLEIEFEKLQVLKQMFYCDKIAIWYVYCVFKCVNWVTQFEYVGNCTLAMKMKK